MFVNRYLDVNRSRPLALTLSDFAALAGWSETFILELEANGAFRSNAPRLAYQRLSEGRIQ